MLIPQSLCYAKKNKRAIFSIIFYSLRHYKVLSIKLLELPNFSLEVVYQESDITHFLFTRRGSTTLMGNISNKDIGNFIRNVGNIKLAVPEEVFPFVGDIVIEKGRKGFGIVFPDEFTIDFSIKNFDNLVNKLLEVLEGPNFEDPWKDIKDVSDNAKIVAFKMGEKIINVEDNKDFYLSALKEIFKKDINISRRKDILDIIPLSTEQQPSHQNEVAKKKIRLYLL